MGGIIHHFLVGVASLIFVYLFTKRRDYSASIFIGNFLPDLVGASYAAITIRSLSPITILQSATWLSFEKNYVILSFWAILQVIFVLAYLYYHVYIRKKILHHETEANIGFLLIGFITHLVMDIVMIEQWILY